MDRVMIVEDEMLVRLGFKNSVSWDKYGMTVCADAANGQEAWDYYSRKEKPDIVITDLRMPVMDGLELIRKIREQDAQTRIVILSCMEDFDLIRQAMQLGVSGYILKLTMTEEEIDGVLMRVRDELGTQRSIGTSAGLIRNPDVWKENVIKNYVFYNLYSEQEFNRHIANLRLRLHPQRLVVCMMEIDHFRQVQEKFQDEKGELIRATFMNVLGELLDQSERGEAVADEEHRFLFILSFPDMTSEHQIRDEVNGMLSQIQSVLKRFFNISASFGVSGIRSGYDSLHALYRESKEAVGQKFYRGTSSIVHIGEDGAPDADETVKRKLMLLGEKWSMLEEAGRSQLETLVESFASAGRLRHIQDIRKLFVLLLHWPAITDSLSDPEATKLVLAYEEELQHCETLDESLLVFGAFLDEIRTLRGAKKQLDKEAAQAVRYIQERFGSEISLQQIAEHLELTPNYLSALFKKELGMNFTEYLNRLRLEKAKELLMTTNLKSYEIAARIGFTDDSYFSRAFKKYVGVRPNGFRRLWVNDGTAGAEDES